MLVGSVTVAGQEWREEFTQGNEFYEEKDYESAIRMYRAVLDQGVESAEVHFNLGNAYFKSGDLGRAVASYLRARRLAPADDDIKANLEFARQFSSVQMEGVRLNPIDAFMESLVGPFHLSFMAWVSTALFVIFLVAVALRWGFAMATTWLRSLLIVSLVLLVLAAGLTTYKYRHDYVTRRAVVVAEDSPVYTGPSENSDLELQGAPGLIVEILDESGDYYEVLFENRRRGWIAKDLVAIV
jgi:tetratricopeptide (TPR) repeat protein